MDLQIERKCSELIENYNSIVSISKMGTQEMVLACAGLYIASGIRPDINRLEECKKLLRSKEGIFSHFRGADEPLIICKMALSDDPALYYENVVKVHQRIKTFLSGEQTVLAAMILAEQGAPEEEPEEKTKQIYQEMKETHPWLTSENDLPFAAMMAVSGKDVSAVYAEAEEIYAFLKGKLRTDRDTLQMLSHILAVREGRTEEKCEKLCALADGLKAAGCSPGSGSRLAILGLLADSGIPTDALIDQICDADDYLKQYKPFQGVFSVGKETRRMFAVQMVQASFSGEDSLGVSAMLTASIEIAIISMILMLIIVNNSAAAYH